MAAYLPAAWPEKEQHGGVLTIITMTTPSRIVMRRDSGGCGLEEVANGLPVRRKAFAGQCCRERRFASLTHWPCSPVARRSVRALADLTMRGAAASMQRRTCEIPASSAPAVVPANAGTHTPEAGGLGSRFRGEDEGSGAMS
jgi:hypothetical protein